MRWFGATWIGAVILGAGCYRYAPVDIRVVAADTREPIAGASVTGMPVVGLFEFLHPRPVEARTDDAGHARLMLSPDYQHGNGVDASADGYEKGEVYIVAKGQRVVHQSQHRFPAGEPVEIALLRLPPPLITLVIPDDLRGWVRINEPRESDSSRELEGPRDYVLSLAESRDVSVPADLATVHYRLRLRYRAFTPNGSAMPICEYASIRPTPGGIGIWPLWHLDGGRPFFVGTEEEYRAQRRFLWPEDRMDQERFEEWARIVRRELATPPSRPPHTDAP